MAHSSLTAILDLVADKTLAETGGGHNQKGVEFQRNWAIVRMIELEQGANADFLILFEAIQDVAILDSPTAPTKIDIYQVKKKDRGEWSWSSLTSLHTPQVGKPPKTARKIKEKPLSELSDSPLGKLHAAVRAVDVIGASGRFLSNAGCDLPLADGTNAATSVPVALAMLAPELRDLLVKAITVNHGGTGPPPSLDNIFVEKVSIPVDDPSTYTTGIAHAFLMGRSPNHAGQARALVDALLVKIGPLGAKTDKCKTYDEIVQRHGFSRDQFAEALGALQSVPDLLKDLDLWLSSLIAEGMGHIEVMGIRSSAAMIYRRQLTRSAVPEYQEVIDACDAYLMGKADPPKLLPFFQQARAHLQAKFPDVSSTVLQAHFALRAIKCAAQTSVS